MPGEAVVVPADLFRELSLTNRDFRQLLDRYLQAYINLHTDVEAYEDEPTRGACLECGDEFALHGSPADRDAPIAVAEQEPATEAHDDAVTAA